MNQSRGTGVLAWSLQNDSLESSQSESWWTSQQVSSIFIKLPYNSIVCVLLQGGGKFGAAAFTPVILFFLLQWYRQLHPVSWRQKKSLLQRLLLRSRGRACWVTARPAPQVPARSLLRVVWQGTALSCRLCPTTALPTAVTSPIRQAAATAR